jgi:hypothetical protein
MKEITLNAEPLISITFLIISKKDGRDFSWYKEALSFQNEPKQAFRQETNHARKRWLYK